MAVDAEVSEDGTVDVRSRVRVLKQHISTYGIERKQCSPFDWVARMSTFSRLHYSRYRRPVDIVRSTYGGDGILKGSGIIDECGDEVL